MGIVVIGATFIDVKGYPLSLYIPGGRNSGRVEQLHGGVCRNIVEDIANVELRPTFVSVIDPGGMGDDAIHKLKNHKVNTDYILRRENGMGTWLAIFDNSGDVVASISKRPDLSELAHFLQEKGDEIISSCDAVALEFDIETDTLKTVLQLAEKYRKPVYAAVSNMSIAIERRDLIQRISCFVCNLQEAGIYFMENYEGKSPEEIVDILRKNCPSAGLSRMVVTMGSRGAVYYDHNGEAGIVPSVPVHVIDTTGAGDAFFAGVTIGLTYGKTLKEACGIGTRLASSVITTKENVCPRFLPEEFGLKM